MLPFIRVDDSCSILISFRRTKRVRRKRKKCYNFKRKNNVCLSAYITYGSHVRKELLSHPHLKRNERREPEIDFFFFLFVCDFFLFICICTFVCAPFACRLAATTTVTTTNHTNIWGQANMACPLNIPSSYFFPSWFNPYFNVCMC